MDILIILQSCHHLHELVLEWCLKEEEITQILGFPQIVRFTCEEDSRAPRAAFIRDIMLQHPQLAYLNISKCEYSRSEGKLCLDKCSDILSVGLLEGLVEACSPISFLRIAGNALQYDYAAKQIVLKLSETLRHFEVSSVDVHLLENILNHCKLLTTLILSGSVYYHLLGYIASRCPHQLAQIVFLGMEISEAMDEVLATFISKCSNLQTLTLRGISISFPKTLHAILDCRLPLASIRLQLRNIYSNIDRKAFHHFRKQAQEKQLLPVPKIYGL